MNRGVGVVESSDDHHNASSEEKGIPRLLAGKLASLHRGQGETEEGGKPLQIGEDSSSESSSESESDNEEPEPEQTNGEPGGSCTEEASAQSKNRAMRFPLLLSHACVRGSGVKDDDKAFDAA